MRWEVNGVWGDSNMPDVDLLSADLFGTHTTQTIDISEAIEYLKVIRSGEVLVDTNYTQYSYINVEYSLDDGETFTPVENDGKGFFSRGKLLGVSNDMKLQIRTHIKSRVVDILPFTKLEVYKIKVTLSDKPWDEEWNKTDNDRLEWSVSLDGQ